jgi:hypothetical protein
MDRVHVSSKTENNFIVRIITRVIVVLYTVKADGLIFMFCNTDKKLKRLHTAHSF